jgi:RNA polymerase sigma-70 factor (ECF subfamily)
MALAPESNPLRGASDEALVALVLAEGSEIAFRVMYDRHAPRLHRVACLMLASETDADDVVQETWIRALARLDAFAWRSALGTWLTAITINLTRDVLARQKRWVDVELDEELMRDDGNGVAVPVELEGAIALLPPGCRAAFVLHDVEGFTHQEIGEQMGYTAGTSKSHVFRARRILRRLLSGAEVEEESHG